MERWLQSPIKGLLLDISGVLKNGDSPIDGSQEALKALSKDYKYRLLTNETQVSQKSLYEQLIQQGFDIPSQDFIISPAPVLVKYLKEHGMRPLLLVHPNILVEFVDLDKNNPNCVVIGDAAEHFTYDALNTVFQFMMRNRYYPLFSMGKGKYYKENNDLMLDVGAFTAALEYATDATARVIGKPAASFFQHGVQSLGLPSDEIVMIGDDVVGDVGGAQNAGIRGILVKTGKYLEGDETKYGVIPDGVGENLCDIIWNLIMKVSNPNVQNTSKSH